MPLNIITIAKEKIRNRVLELLNKEAPAQDLKQINFKFETPPEEKLGHIAFACFPLAKILKKSPALIAKSLAGRWEEGREEQSHAVFEKLEPVGPYLNFFLNPGCLAARLIPACVNDERYGDNDAGKDKILLLEYSSPNTNKPLHLGHGRNNLLGMSLAAILERCRYRVIKANLVNDRGIHICKSMLAYQKWGNNETPETSGLKGDKLIGKYYVLYDQKEKENPRITKEIRQMLRDWEAGEPETMTLWEKLNGWALEGFQETYQRMGTDFDKYYFESQTYKKGKELVQKALKKGLCFTEDNGAVAVDLGKLGKKILLRGDGTSVYITQDIAATVQKFWDFDLESCLFVVGDEQDNHFRVLFKTLEKLGCQWADSCEHISYGMITLPEGKMKSREGTVVDLDDLMDQMKNLAAQELDSRRQGGDDRTEAELEETAEAIGQAAVKFYILRTNANKEIHFNPEESLSFDGATGPYLQYTHARICSVLRKYEMEADMVVLLAKLESLDILAQNHDWQKDETTLLTLLARYPDAMLRSALDRNPAALCAFIYDLCRAYNKFYYQHPILKAGSDEVKSLRLLLSEAVKAVLSKTLRVLGISALERM